jgi:transcriptional regulator with XRE-family HTH domain
VSDIWKANRLRVLRAERRLTQRDVAQRIGMSQATYWKFENAYAEPDARWKERIATALNVAVVALVPSAGSDERLAS